MAAVGLVVALCVVAVVPAHSAESASEELRPRSLGDFELDTSPWTTNDQGGARGRVVRDTALTAGGTGSAKWTVTVPMGIAGLGRDVDDLDARALTFSAQSDTATGLTVRLRDSTGQTHQQNVTLTPSASQFTDIVIDDFDAGTGYTSDGGAADGVWHGPLTRISFVAAAGAGLPTDHAVDIRLDDIAVDLPVPEFEIAPTRLGNVFDEGSPIGVGFDTTAASLSWTIRDADGATVATGAGTAADLGGVIDIDPLAVGWYEVQIDAVRADGSTFRSGTDVAVLPVADPAPDDRRGVAVHYGQNWSVDSIPLISRAGFGFARDEAYWNQQETVKGDLEFTPKVIDYTAALAAADIDYLNILAYGNSLYHDYEAPLTDAGRAGFAEYAKASIAQFGVDDTIYEVWNEWNWRKLNEPAGGSPQTYVQLLKTTSDTVRPAHPGAKLIGPALTPALTTWPAWIDGFIAAGGLDYIDAFSTHPYNTAGTPETTLDHLAIIRGKLDAAGRSDLPIVITEQGWHTSTGARNVDEQTQSAYLVRAQLLSLAAGVEKYTIYDLKDDGTDAAEAEHRFGIIGNEYDVRGAYRPKPAYVSQAVLSHEINARAVLGRSEPAPGVQQVDFEGASGETIRALWSTEAAGATVTVESSTDVEVTGLYGSRHDLTPDAADRVTLGLTGDPIFVRGVLGGTAASSQFSLEVGNPITDAPVDATWTVDRTGSTAFTGSLDTGEGSPIATSVAAGATADVPVSLPTADRSGIRTWTVTIEEGGEATGVLFASATVQDALSLTGSHVQDETGADVLRLRVTNRATDARTIDGVGWTVADQSGIALPSAQIPGEGSLTADIPVSISGAIEWTAAIIGVGASEASGKLAPALSPVAVPQAEVVADGVIDQAVLALPAQSLPMPTSSGWGGNADQSGRIWWTHDRDAVTLSVEVEDDVASQPATGQNMWQGDSLQVGLSVGAPGETAQVHEIGAAVTDSGVLTTHRWAPGDLGGDLAGVTAAVTRSPSSSTTVYEMVIPLASLGMTAEDRLLSSTVVVNENDGAGRRGWMSWGSGVADSKNAAGYRSLRLDTGTSP